MARRWAMLALALVLAVGIAIGADGRPAAAVDEGNSIFFYRPGHAVTGVYHNAVYTETKVFTLKNVDLAAASRTSLALYTRDTGKLRTGTFSDGRYRFTKAITIKSGFTHMVASYDTLLLYDRKSGRGLVGTLVDGRFVNRTPLALTPGWTRIAASSGMVRFNGDIADGHAGEVYILGSLSGGTYEQTQLPVWTNPVKRLAMTGSSYVLLSIGGFGEWGTLGQGGDTTKGTSTDFSAWDILAGTASTILFYTKTGTGCAWWMSDGQIKDQPCGLVFLPGWTIITGAK